MKLMLTGASGFIGRHLLPLLEQHGINYVVVGRRKPASVLQSSFIGVDLLSGQPLTAVFNGLGCTHLLHLAWQVEPGKFWHSLDNVAWICATSRLVDAFAKAGGQHVVVAGSCAEYSQTAELCDEYLTPTQADTLYGTAKDATHRLLAHYCAQHELSLGWARVFLPYGVGEDRRKIISALVDTLGNHQAPFKVQLDHIRDFIHVRDVARALLTLVVEPAHGSFNVCSAEPLSIRELIGLTGQLLSADTSAFIHFSSEGQGSKSKLVGHNKRLQALGWSPSTTLESGITEMIARRQAR